MQFGQLKRREFITFVGSAAAAWTFTAHAQQGAMPVIGFLNPTLPEAIAEPMRSFRQSLKDAGYVEGERGKSRWNGAKQRRDQGSQRR
jgi:putative tryptophan/tyrosine transport system substrate-binding protein